MSTICRVRMAVPSSQESIQKSRAKDLYTEIRPIWWALLLVMSAPIQRGKSGTIKSDWLSWSGLLTLGICAVNWWVVYYAFPVQIKALHESETFPEEVFASLFIMGLNVHVMIPITAWPFAKKLAIYLNDWTEFQEHYARVCGRQLQLHLYDLSRVLACVCLLVLPLTIVEFTTVTDAPMWHSCAYFPTALHSVAVTCAWHCNCVALGGAAEKMSEDFAIAITTPGSLAVKIRKYRNLWNSLQKLSVALSRAQSATILQVALLLMSLNLISAFGVLGAVIAEVSASRIIVMLVMASVTHVQILFMSSSGFECAEKINMEMRKQLLSLTYRRTIVDEHEVNLFLKDMANRPACIRIIGYLDVDRNMYVKIVAALARNFLVLLQFAYTGAKAAIRPTEIIRDDFYDFI